MEITADNINVSSDDPAISQWTPAGGCAVTVRWLSMSRLPADHPWVTVRRPDGERQMSVQPPVGFFPPIAPRIPTGHRAEAGRQLGGVPRDTGRWVNLRDIGLSFFFFFFFFFDDVTSAYHPAKFNCELKCLGCRRMSKGWALQECLFGQRPPDFCRIWCKSRRAPIRRSIFLYWDGTLKADSSVILCLACLVLTQMTWV